MVRILQITIIPYADWGLAKEKSALLDRGAKRESLCGLYDSTKYELI